MLYSITGISFTYVLISLGMNLARNSTCNMKQSGTKTWRFGCVHCVIFGYHGFETALYYLNAIILAGQAVATTNEPNFT